LSIPDHIIPEHSPFGTPQKALLVKQEPINSGGGVVPYQHALKTSG